MFTITQNRTLSQAKGIGLQSVGRSGKCYWSSPVNTFLVLSSAGLMTIFYSLTNLGVMQLCHHRNQSTASLKFYLRFI
jgi:hypothetical protein